MTNLVFGGGSAEAYTIDQSLRFNDGDSPYLTRTPAVTGNQKTFTVSCWVKRWALAWYRPQFVPASCARVGRLRSV